MAGRPAPSAYFKYSSETTSILFLFFWAGNSEVSVTSGSSCFRDFFFFLTTGSNSTISDSRDSSGISLQRPLSQKKEQSTHEWELLDTYSVVLFWAEYLESTVSSSSSSFRDFFFFFFTTGSTSMISDSRDSSGISLRSTINHKKEQSKQE